MVTVHVHRINRHLGENWQLKLSSQMDILNLKTPNLKVHPQKALKSLKVLFIQRHAESPSGTELKEMQGREYVTHSLHLIILKLIIKKNLIIIIILQE